MRQERLRAEEILYETYAKTINIEALTMIDMASKQILPAVIRYTKTLADTVIAVREAGVEPHVQAELLKETGALLEEARKALEVLKVEDARAAAMPEGKEQAYYYKDVVKEAMAALRTPIDALEMIVDKEMWPMPSYGDLIFEV